MMRAVFIALLTIGGIPVMALGQASPTAANQHEHADQQAPAQAQDQQMMQMHQKMMADMAAMDQKLDGLVAQMNAAQGQAKMDAMAAVITEMINDRKQMREHMAAMMGQGGMMGGGAMMGGGMMGRGMGGGAMSGQGRMMGGQGQRGMMAGTSGMMPGAPASTFDPVCRARIADKSAPTATYQGKTYQFCSEADKREFLKNPAKYLGTPR